jgi:hypothetical protein
MMTRTRAAVLQEFELEFKIDGVYTNSHAQMCRAVINMADRICALESGNTPKQKPRRFREYKGVTYRDGKWWYHQKLSSYTSAVQACYHFIGLASDEDHAALLALRDDPYEPVETLEDVIKRARNEWWSADAVSSDALTHYIARTVQAWMDTQVPDIDAAAEVLLRNGWKDLRGSDGLSEAFNELYRGSRILVLPAPEVSRES